MRGPLILFSSLSKLKPIFEIAGDRSPRFSIWNNQRLRAVGNWTRPAAGYNAAPGPRWVCGSARVESGYLASRYVERVRMWGSLTSLTDVFSREICADYDYLPIQAACRATFPSADESRPLT